MVPKGRICVGSLRVGTRTSNFEVESEFIVAIGSQVCRLLMGEASIHSCAMVSGEGIVRSEGNECLVGL